MMLRIRAAKPVLLHDLSFFTTRTRQSIWDGVSDVYWLPYEYLYKVEE